jgi:hypothetical protein
LLSERTQSCNLDDLALPNSVCLQVALEIEKKLDEIQAFAEQLPVATKAKKEMTSTVLMLKV